MKGIAGRSVAVLVALVAATAGAAPPAGTPGQGVDKEHARLMNRMERTRYQMRKFQGTMEAEQAHAAFQELGSAIEQTWGRLGVVERRIGRLCQDPVLRKSRERLESLTQARDRFRAMIEETEEAHKVLRRTVEQKAKLGDPMTAEEHAHHETLRQERAKRMEALTGNLTILCDRLRGSADPMEIEDLAMDLEKIRDRVQVMMDCCGTIHEDANFKQDRNRLKVMGPLHDRLDALLSLMEEACSSVERAAGV